MPGYLMQTAHQHLNAIRAVALTAASAALLLAATGCQTTPKAAYAEASATAPASTGASTNAAQSAAPSQSLLLHEGDTLRISFPGAPDLNRVVLIRRDGKVTLPLIGEFQAAGMSPTDLEKKLIDAYGPQLQVKEVNVAVESSAFPIYVTGAVVRPGKILSDRPINALQAIMEAGGFDYAKANLKKVRVIRHEEGRERFFDLDLKSVLQGQKSEPFPLKPGDIIYVPERFVLF